MSLIPGATSAPPDRGEANVSRHAWIHTITMQALHLSSANIRRSRQYGTCSERAATAGIRIRPLPALLTAARTCFCASNWRSM